MTRKEIYESVLAVALEGYGEREGAAVANRFCQDLYGFAHFDVVLDGAQQVEGFEPRRFDDSLGRLAAGEPVQYVVGKTEFYGRVFVVQQGVLIPRPETEELVARIVHNWRHRAPRIMDLGTGSGAIAVALACEIAGSRVEALDLSPVAVSVARQNARINGAKVEIAEGDIFAWQPASESYDVIVSNPPYIPASERSSMERNVVEFEPSEALFVPDEEPLLYYRRIAESAQVGLRSGGELFFEIHENFSAQVVQMLCDMGYEQVELSADMNSKPRMVWGRKA